MNDNFGFGNFKFRYPDGKLIKEVTTISNFKKILGTIPSESLEYHSSKNHLSNWFATRGEFELASNFRKLKKTDFATIEKRRKHHLNLLNKIKFDHDAPIIEFSNLKQKSTHNFIQIGGGSLGGKARGLAFANGLLINDNFKSKILKYEFQKSFQSLQMNLIILWKQTICGILL